MVLLVTFSEDYYTVDLVRDSLQRRNVESVRVNMDDFPLQMYISTSVNNETASAVRLKVKDRLIDMIDIEAVWLRKHSGPRINSELEPEYRSGAYTESKEVLDILMHYAGKHLAMIDPMENIQRASNKFLQLETAREVGISVPDTLITNDPAELKDFYNRQHNGNVIAKMLTPLSSSMTGSSFFVYTSKVEPEHLDDAEMLTNCPMAFQEMIEKAYELRIIYVDGNFFTGKIDASKTKLGKVDWRLSQPGEVDWESYDLPTNLCAKLDKLMKKFDLLYGAIDMIKTPDGRYVFLEVNPIGEWGMLQRDLNLPIADAIADAIIKKIANKKATMPLQTV